MEEYTPTGETKMEGVKVASPEPTLWPAQPSKDELAVDVKAVLSTRLRRKIDLRVLGPLVVLYVMCFLDRTNIGSAVIFGLQEDLKLGGTQYNTALVCFFIPYVILDIPSNVLLWRLKPQTWLPTCALLFGVITVLQGLVQNFGGLAAVRFFLGVAEAGIYPGCMYTLSCFYRRDEAQTRFAVFVGSTTLAGAFGGLLASAIGKLNGVSGMLAWRWIFILEGCLTVCVAGVLFALVTDLPEGARWLSGEELRALKAHLKGDGLEGEDKEKGSAIGLRDVGDALKDVKLWLAGLMYLGIVMPANGLAFFIPTIVRGLGYSPISTQLHTIPLFVVSAAFAFLVAMVADKIKMRTPGALFSIIVSIVGFCALQSDLREPHVRYGFLFVAGMGVFGAMVAVLCWHTMNCTSSKKRAIGAAWQVSFGNIGGIISTYSFLKSDAPEFRVGCRICIGFLCMAFLSCVAYLLVCMLENRRISKRPVEEDTGSDGRLLRENGEFRLML